MERIVEDSGLFSAGHEKHSTAAVWNRPSGLSLDAKSVDTVTIGGESERNPYGMHQIVEKRKVKAHDDAD